MDSAKAETWCRFYDTVLCDTTRPRGLWFAAVDDALRAALPQDSRLLEMFRAKVAELTQLERAASGSPQVLERRDQLEEEIGRLLSLADATIRQGADPPGKVAEATKQRWGLSRLLGVFGAATLLFGIVWWGANYYYELRTSDQVDRQLRPYIEDLRQTLEKVQADLVARREAPGSLQGELRALRDELDQRAQMIGTALKEPHRELKARINKEVADLEQRLLEESGDLVRALDGLRQRADVLDGGLEEVENALSSLRAPIPALEQAIDGVAEHISSAGLVVETTTTQVAAWEGVMARPAGWSLNEADAGLEEAEGQRPTPLPALNRQIALLADEVDRSRQSLKQVNSLLDQNLGRAKLGGMALKDAVGGAQTVGRQLGELITQVSTEVEAVRLKIEQVVAGFADRAEEALQQSREALERAESLVSHGGATREQGHVVEGAREEHLGALVARTTAMRAALEQARIELLGRWEEADQRGREGYAKLVADLDRYAEVVEGRVQELLDAVDVIVARAELPPSRDP